jgi:hypothetical protein
MVKVSKRVYNAIEVAGKIKSDYDKIKSYSDNMQKVSELWAGLTSDNLCCTLKAVEKVLGMEEKKKKGNKKSSSEMINDCNKKK